MLTRAAMPNCIIGPELNAQGYIKPPQPMTKKNWKKGKLMQGDGIDYIDGLVQNCGISSALALEIPQSCTKLSIRLSIQAVCLLCWYTADVLSAQQTSRSIITGFVEKKRVTPPH